jgi:hypothetical protein
MDELGYIPARIVGGESIWISAANTAQSSQDIIISGFTPAGGYTLAYQFAAATPFSVTAAANGANTGWTLDVTGVQTLTMKPGRVAFAGIITKTDGGRTFAVDSGGLVVIASPLRVSSWVAVLAAIDAAFLTVSTSPNGSVSIDGMSVSYRGASDLISIRNYAQERLNSDNGRRGPSRILSRFV